MASLLVISSRSSVCLLAFVTIVASCYWYMRADQWNTRSRASVGDNVTLEKSFYDAAYDDDPSDLGPPVVITEGSHLSSPPPTGNITSSASVGDNVTLEKSLYDAAYDDDPFDLGNPVVITEGSHVSSPPPTGQCSCWNETRDCCERGVHPSHKFGHLLVETLFGEEYNLNWNGETFRRNFLSLSEYFNRSHDYREVFVTRDWYDALVSGYLYHKAGNECWRDSKTGKTHRVKGRKSEEKILPFLQSPKPFPPFRGRDMCHYLVEEDEEDGIRVYSEWVIRHYYMDVVTIFKAVQQQEDPRHRRTLFLCFEDLADPVTKLAVTKQIIDWLYPGGQEGHLPSVTDAPDFRKFHATSHESHMRSHLRSVVGKVDKQAFHGGIQRLSDMFGCGRDP